MPKLVVDLASMRVFLQMLALVGMVHICVGWHGACLRWLAWCMLACNAAASLGARPLLVLSRCLFMLMLLVLVFKMASMRICLQMPVMLGMMLACNAVVDCGALQICLYMLAQIACCMQAYMLLQGRG